MLISPYCGHWSALLTAMHSVLGVEKQGFRFWGDLYIPTVEALPTTEPPKIHLKAIHSAAAQRGVLINK